MIGDRSLAWIHNTALAYAQGLRAMPGCRLAISRSRRLAIHNGGATTPPLDDLVGDDLAPYRTLVTQAPVGDGGHLQVPADRPEPASLSKAVVSLLRTARIRRTAVRWSSVQRRPLLVWPRSQTGLAS